MSMAECKQAVLVEKETAHRDCLTGCYDRMTIQHLVDLCFLKSDVRQSHAMFVIDVDNFKRVNDTWGREFGDIVLNDVAAVLRRIFRRSDYIGRIGDDEFLVLLRDVEPERLSEKKAQEFYTAGYWRKERPSRCWRRNFIRPSARCFPPVAMSAINRRVVSA